MPDETPNQDSGTLPEANAPQQETSAPVSEETVKKLIQSETDKVRTKYAQELAVIRQENETLRKERMSDAERKKYEESLLKDQLSKKEAELVLREQTLLAIDLLKEKGIPDNLRSFVIGSDENATRANIDKLNTEFQRAIEATVKDRFKELGGIPGKASEDPKSPSKIYTRAEIADMAKRAQNPSTPSKDRAALNKEMQDAMHSGRVQK